MRVSVVIPYKGDPSILSWALRGYAAQVLSPGVQVAVRVGLDGEPLPGQPLVPALLEGGSISFSVQSFDRLGAAEIRNRLADLAAPSSADILIIANGDCRPEPDFVQRHIDRLQTLPPKSMLLGASPYERVANPTVLDALFDNTPAIFFYCQMQPHNWYDFRHAWTLNLSLRHEDFLSAGGFDCRLRPPFYEDISLAARIMGTQHKGVYYDNAIRVWHRHPMTLEQYLNREESLGILAPVLFDTAPHVFHALFGEEPVAALAEKFEPWTQMDHTSHRWIYRRLGEWIHQPATILGQNNGESFHRQLNAIYQMHIPLKRLAFRLGFLHGMSLRDDAHWRERKPLGLWKQIVDPAATNDKVS